MTAVADQRGAEPSSNAAESVADVRIRDAVIRLESAIARRPGFGRSTNASTTTLVDGLRCLSREGDHEIACDLSPNLGGRGDGPPPGVLVRAAVGSCLAMMYRMRAARAGVELRSITVVVETDSAIEGMACPGSTVPAGFAEIRYRVEIVSDADPELVVAIVDEADGSSPMLDVVARANRAVRSLSVVTGDD